MADKSKFSDEGIFSNSFSKATDRVFVSTWTPEKVIGCIFIVITAVLIATHFFCVTDKVPATFFDYNELYERLNDVVNDREKLLLANGKIEVVDGNVYYTVENEQCMMTGLYDTELNLNGAMQKDKAVSGVLVFFTCFFGAILVIFYANLVYQGILILFWSLVYVIISFVKKIKEKDEEELKNKTEQEEQAQEE